MADKKDLDAERRQFFEEMGLMFEGTGMPRMAGRVLGWLLMCDPPHQTATQVGDVVGASKGSISTMLRHLVGTGIVERMGVPGERSKFYRIRDGAWVEHLRERTAFTRSLRQLAERGLTLMQGEEPPLLRRLQDFRDLHAFFEREMPAMLERYEKETGE
jgi:DNA-binding transcriptional regulator GbsR (MarR family)